MLSKFIVAAALVAAANADQTLFSMTCDGHVHFAPTSPLGSSIDVSHVYGATMKAYTASVTAHAKEVCPSITDQQILDHLIIFNFDAVLKRVSPGAGVAQPPPLPKECARWDRETGMYNPDGTLWSELDDIDLSDLDVTVLPSSCVGDKWKSDKCKVKVNMTNIMPGFPIDIQATLAYCPGQPLPSASFHCVGDNCQYMGKFCESNADCGGTECTSLKEIVEEVGELTGMFYNGYANPPTPMPSLIESAKAELTWALNAANIVMADEEEKCIKEGYNFAGQFLYKAQNMYNYAIGSTQTKLAQKFSSFKMCGIGYIKSTAIIDQVDTVFGSGSATQMQAMIDSFVGPTTHDPKLEVKSFASYAPATSAKSPLFYGDCFGNYQMAHPNCPFHGRAVAPLFSQLTTMANEIMADLMPCRSAQADWDTMLPTYFYPWAVEFWAFLLEAPAAFKVGCTDDQNIKCNTIKSLLFSEEFSLGMAFLGMPSSCDHLSMTQGKCGGKIKLDDFLMHQRAPLNNGGVSLEMVSCPKQGSYTAGKVDCVGGICTAMNRPFKIPSAGGCDAMANTGCSAGYDCFDLTSESRMLTNLHYFMSDVARLLLGETTSATDGTICLMSTSGEAGVDNDGYYVDPLEDAATFLDNTVIISDDYTQFTMVPGGNVENLMQTIRIPTTTNPYPGAPGTTVNAGTADKPRTTTPETWNDFGGGGDVSAASSLMPSVSFALTAIMLAVMLY